MKNYLNIVILFILSLPNVSSKPEPLSSTAEIRVNASLENTSNGDVLTSLGPLGPTAEIRVNASLENTSNGDGLTSLGPVADGRVNASLENTTRDVFPLQRSSETC